MRDLSKIKNLEQLETERQFLLYRAEEQERQLVREAGRIQYEWQRSLGSIRKGISLVKSFFKK